MQTVFQTDTMPDATDKRGSALSILQIARNYVDAGFSVIPIATDGTKRPASNRLPLVYDEREGKSKPKWEPFAERKPTNDELAEMFTEGVGIAVIHGAVSGNSEALDFDEPRLGYEYREKMKSSGVGDLAERLAWIDTPSGGAQAWYRCDEPPEGNHHLAKQADGRKARIETRGERGYTVAPGSPGACHPTGNPYRVVHGDPTDLPILSADDRAILHAFASLFNLYVEPESIIRETDYCADRLPGASLRPGDDYNERGPVLELLERHGWRVQSYGAGYHLRRPGKDRGWSATFGIAEPRLFYCFTSGDQYFRENKGYLPFTAYVLLEHNGDASAAAKALYAQGYGARAHVTPPRPSENAARWIEPEPEEIEAEESTEEIPADDLADIEAEEQESDQHTPDGETVETSDEETAEEESEPISDDPPAQAEKAAPAKEKPLPGLILDIANVLKNLPVKVTEHGLRVDAEANPTNRRQVFKCVANLAKDSILWFNFAIGDAYNALPGDYGAKNAYVEKHFKGYYQRFRQLASISRRWSEPMRKEGVCWSFYEISAAIQDPARREAFLNRYVAKDITLAQLKAEVRLIKAAQKEAKERKEQAEERQHVRHLAELTPNDTERREQAGESTAQTITLSIPSVATLPLSEVPSMLLSLRESVGGSHQSSSVVLAQVHAEVDAMVALGYTPEILLHTLRQIHGQNAPNEIDIVQPLIHSDDSISMAESVPVLDELDFAENCENEIDIVQILNNVAPQTLTDELPQIVPSMPSHWKDAGYTEGQYDFTQRMADALGVHLNKLSYEKAQTLRKLPSLELQRQAWVRYTEIESNGFRTPAQLMCALRRVVKEEASSSIERSVASSLLPSVQEGVSALLNKVASAAPLLPPTCDSDTEPTRLAQYDALVEAAKSRLLPPGIFVLAADPPIETPDLNLRVIRIHNAYRRAVENCDTVAMCEQLHLLSLCQRGWEDHEQQCPDMHIVG